MTSMVKVFMTPQDDRTATVLSDMLGKHTVVSKTESQSRIRELDDSANISRRSEERPLISPGRLLQFPLDQVLVLPEGQYPIQAHHIRYYEDHHFAGIEAARHGHPLPYPPLTAKPKQKVASLAQIAQAEKSVETYINAIYEELWVSREQGIHSRVRATLIYLEDSQNR